MSMWQYISIVALLLSIAVSQTPASSVDKSFQVYFVIVGVVAIGSTCMEVRR